ncbi:hypothetical protein HYS85_00955 [Candidatus Saccharibacteria bacterium]|nr:hypothetical protein [Candidatus Saccharibacteria bacterium]
MLISGFAFIKFIFAASTCTATNFFFFIPPWYKYLALANKLDASCNLNKSFAFPGDIWLIALAVLDMLLRLAGFVAVVAIIIAGVSYIFASGNPEKAASARRRIYNALIGLVVALVATAFVSFIGNRIT